MYAINLVLTNVDDILIVILLFVYDWVFLYLMSQVK